jgi:hypothetical protein
MSATLYFRALAGTVRQVVTETIDGVEKEVERGLHFKRGDIVPAGVVQSDIDRLTAKGQIGPEPAEAIPSSLLAQDGDEPKPGELDLSNLAAATDAELAAGVKNVGAKKLVDAIGSDVELAKRVLVAETAAAAGDVRATLVKPLEKLIGSTEG